ncbi:MAG: hypothetical protein L6V93_09255 [Clostridiales bacterium]|nr:MAG: hypothetical protein L6V93_09255 [Clostridiales bacterium]
MRDLKTLADESLFANIAITDKARNYALSERQHGRLFRPPVFLRTLWTAK